MVTDVTANDSHVDPRWLTRPLAVLVTARAVNQLGAFSLPFLAVLLVQRYAASLATAGLVVTLFGVATIPSRLAGGAVTARIGGRSTMVLGLLLCAVAQLGVALAPGLGVALAAVVLLGLAYEVYEPASQSLIADLTPVAYRSRAFGLFGAALAAGGVLGGLAGVLIGGVDLRLLFVADAGSCLTAATIVRLGLPDPGTRAVARPARGLPWRDRRLLLMLGAGTGFAGLYLQLRIALPLTMVARGVPGARYGLVLAASSLVVVLAQPVLASRTVSRRLRDPFTAMAAGYVLLGAGLAATAFVTSLPGFVLVTVVWALGDALLLGPPFAVVAGLAPPGAGAAYLAAYGCCWGVAGVLAPVAGTGALAWAGPTGLWLGCATVALALAAAQPALRRRVAGERGGDAHGDGSTYQGSPRLLLRGGSGQDPSARDS